MGLKTLFAQINKYNVVCFLLGNSLVSEFYMPTESIKESVLPYSGKGYITTDDNLITHLENCWKYTYV
jgi:hypothetical protein